MTENEFFLKRLLIKKYCPHTLSHFCNGSPNISENGVGNIGRCPFFINNECKNQKIQDNKRQRKADTDNER